jgi:hypothetical protein
MVRCFRIASSLRICLIASLVMPCLSVAGVARIQSAPSNLEQLQNLARLLSDSLLTGYTRHDTFCLRVAEHPAAWIVEQSMLAAAEKQGFRMGDCDSSLRRRIALAITSIRVTYRPLEDADSIERVAELSVDATLPEHGSGTTGFLGELHRPLTASVTDTVAIGDTVSIANPGYEFARASLPSGSKPGFWDKIIEPAVVLGASAVIVILLFTVRSQ